MIINAFPRVIPFALFMAFIGMGEGLHFLAGKGFLSLPDLSLYFLYPIRAVAVALVLLFFLPRYHEIRLRDLADIGRTTVSILIGAAVFILWINMDWTYGTQGNVQGFNPDLLSDKFTRLTFIALRLFGLAAVVPVMEELFWRSFLIRYLVDNRFESVPIGRFTWPSFVVSTLLFGLEHNLFLAGIMAGAAYNALLYYSRSVSQCIVAHAVTNLALGIFILNTGKWQFW